MKNLLIAFSILAASYLVSACNGNGPPIPPDPGPIPTPTPAPQICTTYVGADFMSSTNSKLDCGAVLASFDGVKCPAYGILTDTFGRDYSCLHAFIRERESRGQKYLIRIHLTNECCRRYHAPVCGGNVNCCTDGELFIGTTKENYSRYLEREEGWVMQTLRDRMTWWRDWLNVHLGPNGEVIFSNGLESDFSPKAAKAVDKVIREFGYKTAWNPNGWNGSTNGADYVELHHVHGRPGAGFIHALDGADIKIPGESSCYSRLWSLDKVRDWGRSNRGSKAIMLWHAGAQGLNSCPQRWQYPRRRNFSFSRQSAAIMNQLMKDIEQ